MKNYERITGLLAIMCGGAIVAIAFHLAITLDEERKEKGKISLELREMRLAREYELANEKEGR